jgi:hypothetical protein
MWSKHQFLSLWLIDCLYAHQQQSRHEPLYLHCTRRTCSPRHLARSRFSLSSLAASVVRLYGSVLSDPGWTAFLYACSHCLALGVLPGKKKNSGMGGVLPRIKTSINFVSNFSRTVTSEIHFSQCMHIYIYIYTYNYVITSNPYLPMSNGATRKIKQNASRDAAWQATGEKCK